MFVLDEEEMEKLKAQPAAGNAVAGTEELFDLSVDLPEARKVSAEGYETAQIVALGDGSATGIKGVSSLMVPSLLRSIWL